MNNSWDKISDPYLRGIKTDKFGDFAYEKLVNSLALLSWCENSDSVLDLGCGDGRFTRDLEARFNRVYAIDYSSKMLTQAKKICKRTKFILCNLENTFPEFNLKFDVVVCKLLLMYIRDLDNIAFNVYKYLRPKGILIISVTHPIKWITESNYKGYLHETEIDYPVAKIKTAQAHYSNRTLQSYVNSFARFGFVLQTIMETGVPDSFMIKFPYYRQFRFKPYRLNLKFIKL